MNFGDLIEALNILAKYHLTDIHAANRADTGPMLTEVAQGQVERGKLHSVNSESLDTNFM